MYQESKVQGLKALVDIILQHEGEDIRWCDVLGVMRWEKYGLTWNIRAAWPEYLLTANFARRTMIWIFRRVAPPSKHLKHLYRNTGVEYKYNIKSDKVWPEWYLVNIYIYRSLGALRAPTSSLRPFGPCGPAWLRVTHATVQWLDNTLAECG